MKGFRLFSICLLVVILISSWGPVTVTAAPPASVQESSISTLTINNKTGVDVVVNISGPRSYRWTVKAGRWPFEIDRGKYKVAYTACGKKFKGTLNVTSGKSKMTIAACPMVKAVVYNLTSQNVLLTLTGPAKYTITLIPGVNRFKVIKGVYKYSLYFYSCGESESGIVIFKSNWRYWVYCSK